MASNPRKTPSQQARSKRALKKKNPQKQKEKRLYLSSVPEANKAFKTLSARGRDLQMARSIILPGATNNPTPLPCSATAQLATRIIRKNFTLGSSNLSADGRAAIIITPDMYSPAYIMRPGTTLIPSVPGPFSMSGNSEIGDDPVLGGFYGFQNFRSGSGSEASWADPIHVTLGGDTRTVFDIACVSACTVTAVLKRNSKHDAYVRVRFFTSVAGAWSAAFTGVALGDYGTTVQQTIALAANTRYFGWYFENANGSPYIGNEGSSLRVEISLSYGEVGQTPQATLGGSADHLYQEIPNYILDSKIESGCVNSFSVLVSNSSSQVTKQGQVYAARCNMDVLTNWAQLESNIAALPDNRRYIGLAETGAYAWWMPDTIETAAPDTVVSYTNAVRKQEILIVYLKGLPATATFNVSFSWNVSFYTRNQLFEKIPTPPLTESWLQTFHALANLPAASCNPEHESMFRALVKKVADGAGSAYQHYERNKVLYDSLAKMLMGMI